jgi:hypothetical protein
MTLFLLGNDRELKRIESLASTALRKTKQMETVSKNINGHCQSCDGRPCEVHSSESFRRSECLKTKFKSNTTTLNKGKESGLEGIICANHNNVTYDGKGE